MPTRRFFTANQLKAIALVCMLVDHLWATLVPGREWMTCIGRIAFPIFAFELAQGYIHTRDLRGYAKRLALLAVVSEVPFDMVAGGTYFYPWHQNVAWTLLAGLWAAPAGPAGGAAAARPAADGLRHGGGRDDLAVLAHARGRLALLRSPGGGAVCHLPVYAHRAGVPCGPVRDPAGVLRPAGPAAALALQRPARPQKQAPAIRRLRVLPRTPAGAGRAVYGKVELERLP